MSWTYILALDRIFGNLNGIILINICCTLISVRKNGKTLNKFTFWNKSLMPAMCGQLIHKQCLSSFMKPKGIGEAN